MWQEKLTTSEQQLNAVLLQASPKQLNKGVRDFGKKLVESSSSQLLEHFQPSDIDQSADLILSRASPQFLDRALAHRLETIDARSLVNALSRAERLGYDVQDIVEERAGNGPEHVIPSQHGLPPLNHQTPQVSMQKQSTYQYTPQGSHPPRQAPAQHHGLPQPPDAIEHCVHCQRPVSGASAMACVSAEDNMPS